VPATEQNASASVLRPVSGTPLWARNDHAPGTPRPASPWDEWVIPPKPAALVEGRKTSPHPAEPASEAEFSAKAEAPASAAASVTARAAVTAVIPAVTAPPATTEASGSSTSSVPFRPWRIDFTRPDAVEYPKHPATASPESATITKRLVLLLGLAYLFLAALTSGLAYTGYFTAASTDGTEGPDPDLDSR